MHTFKYLNPQIGSIAVFEPSVVSECGLFYKMTSRETIVIMVIVIEGFAQTISRAQEGSNKICEGMILG